MCSGFFSRPPWNYDLMAIADWLALCRRWQCWQVGFSALFKFVRQPSANGFAAGFSCLVLWAMVHMSLTAPYYSLVKTFFGLSALVPFCVFGALGLDFLEAAERDAAKGSLRRVCSLGNQQLRLLLDLAVVGSLGHRACHALCFGWGGTMMRLISCDNGFFQNQETPICSSPWRFS